MTVSELVEPAVGRRVAILGACVFALGTSLTWAFLSMRSVMDVGGACADGGPYVSAQPCPSGAWLIAVAIPLMIVAAMLGSAVALSLSAPNLLIPMWAVLFGTLGWNFLEYGLTTEGGPVWGWIVCGVVFELMAAPALVAIVIGLRTTLFPVPGSTVSRGALKWWLAYPVIGGCGAVVGLVTYRALS